MWFLEDLSLPKILFILAVVAILFGPKRLPELGKSLGRSIKGFKEALSGDGLIGQINATEAADSGTEKKRQI